MTLFSIAICAILGAFARYGQTQLVQGALGRAFPFATMSINVFGSFLMGLLFVLTLERLSIAPALRTGILTGGLGAYTTFSTFSLESLTLFDQGEPFKALIYVIGSSVLAIGAAALGAYLSRSIGGA